MVIALFLFILMLSLFVSLSARLLGVRLSLFRALTASLLGFFAGTGLAALLIKQDYENASSALLFVLFPLHSTMAFIVLMELMARPGSLMRVQGRLASRPRPLRAIGFKLARTRRYIQMSGIIARHGLTSYLSGVTPAQSASQEVSPSWLAKSLRGTLEEAGHLCEAGPGTFHAPGCPAARRCRRTRDASGSCTWLNTYVNDMKGKIVIYSQKHSQICRKAAKQVLPLRSSSGKWLFRPFLLPSIS